MTNFERWQEANNRHLTVALANLRQRLQKLADAHASAPAGAPTPIVESVKPSWLRSVFARTSPTADANVAGNADAPSPAAATTLAPSALDESAEGEELTPALLLIARRFGLSDFERDVLLMCAAMEFDTRIGALCAHAQGDPTKSYPTFALALAAFDQPSWDVLSPERPLRYWRLIDIHQSGTAPIIASALKLDERVVNYLKGVNHLDDRVAQLLEPLPDEPEPLPPSQQDIVHAITERLRASVGTGRPPVVQLLGNDTVSQLQVAKSVAAALGLALHRIAGDAIPTAIADQETLVRLWQRESVLLPVALYVDATDIDRASAQGAGVQRILGRLGGACLFAAREPWPALARDVISIDVAKPTPPEQKAAWLDALGEDAAAHAQRPATHFNFSVATIRGIAADALAATREDRDRLPEVLWRACLGRARPTLDQLAQRIDAKASWDDLKLPAAEKSVLRQIADQVENRGVVYDDWGFRERMNRGLGVSVLFAGASGTGKTMAAEVIARELGLPLYRVDLSTVVSKYIGETEKNLRRLFDAAEDGGAILHCDEADALFGKRSEVKDSHDRYANIEVNYLLQRMEAFSGLAILTTNMRSALDSAFLRRLRFVVNFPFPAPAERKAIWESAFPPGADIGELDFDHLARFNLSGGSIHSVALNAAFLAARSRGRVTMPHVLDAARAEFRKLEKPINEAEFRRFDSVSTGSA